jgi:predicted DNA-binding transcriptional regulator AlpA
MRPDSRLMPALADPGPVRTGTAGTGHIIEPLLSIGDLCCILACDRRTVERMRSAGRLPRPDLHVGRMPRWRAATIRAWIEGGDRR